MMDARFVISRSRVRLLSPAPNKAIHSHGLFKAYSAPPVIHDHMTAYQHQRIRTLLCVRNITCTCRIDHSQHKTNRKQNKQQTRKEDTETTRKAEEHNTQSRACRRIHSTLTKLH